MGMMKKKSRTLINIIGLPLILFLVYQGGFLFKCFIYIVSILAIKELSNLTRNKNYSINSKFLYCMIPVMYFANSYYCQRFLTALIDYWHESHLTAIIIEFIKMDIVGVIMILIICLWEIFRSKQTPFENIAITYFGLFWVILFLDKIIFIRNMQGGLELTLCMFFSVWSCDSAAFYFGS